MKLNWKIRFKSKTFIAALFSLILLLAQQVTAIFGVDITVYNSQITDIFNTVLAIVVLLGVVQDSTTPGLGDSQRALMKEKRL